MVNQHAKRKPAQTTESTRKPKDSGKRNNKSPMKSKLNSKETQHSPGRNGNNTMVTKENGRDRSRNARPSHHIMH
eukprot:scaffold421154_cov63-Attheya_sp.AAC.3